MRTFIKKYLTTIASVALIAGMLLSPVAAQAQTVSSLTSAQISAIISLLQSFGADQSIVNSVETSLNGIIPSTAGSSFCYNWNNNLTVGSTGADVSALYSALSHSGIQVIPAGSSGMATGSGDYFSENTASLVIQFQQKYSITPLSGYVGPKTRTELNSLYGCANQPANPTTTSFYITPTTVAVAGDVFAYNSGFNNEYSELCFDNTNQSPNACSGISVPSNFDATNPSMSFIIPSTASIGSHTVQVCGLGEGSGNETSGCTGNANLTIVSGLSSPTSNSPIITSITPTFGSIGTAVTLTGINFIPNGTASAPLINQSTVVLSGKAYYESIQPTSVSPTTLSFVIPNDVNPVGVYSVEVENTTNISASGSEMNQPVTTDSNPMNFSVTSNPSQVFTVTSPAAGATLQIGQTYTIAWTGIDTANPSGLPESVYLAGGATAQGPLPIIASNLPITTQSYSWTISSTVQPATNYEVCVGASVKGGSGGCSQPFTIASVGSSVPGQLPNITSITNPASVGGAISIAGSGFNSNSLVIINGPAYQNTFAPTSISTDGTGLTFVIPPGTGAPSGQYTAQVEIGMKGYSPLSNTVNFTVVSSSSSNPTSASPVISSVTPVSGPVGTVVTLSGSNFVPVAGSILVGQAVVHLTGPAYGETIQPTSVSPSSLSFVIPNDANPAGVYNVQVTNITGSGMSSQVPASSNIVNFNITSSTSS